MVARFLLFFAIVAIPPVAFAVIFRHAAYLWSAALALPGAWWAVSPVSWPAWLIRGLKRSLAAAAALALLLFLTR